ncbi:MAG: hypothetical protein AB1600_01155 [Bacteroidota bacterium]
MRIFIFACIALTAFNFSFSKQKNDYTKTLNDIAEKYVRLILDIGQIDPDYVDAYYGPKEWQEESAAMKHQPTALLDRVNALLMSVNNVRVPTSDKRSVLRKTYLTKQLIAAQTRIEMLNGKKFTFDEEARLLYDVAPPKYSEKHFSDIIQQLNAVLPEDTGTIAQRYQTFRNQFIIPTEKLDTVFTAAITECRKRTKQMITLPENEHFVVEYVTDKPWSGYNWYKGNAYSVIQVNTDFPIFIDRAVDLAAHEGYPGHHVYNALLESELMKNNGWIEFCIYPLFSPQSLIAEGSANYGVDVVLPKEERMKFEKDVLFPLAGLDANKADQYYRVQSLVAELNYAGNEAARGYLNGTMTKEQAIDWLVKYGLFEPKRAEQRLRFIEKYRSYVINYNYGQDLVKQYVEKKAGKNATAEKRWSVFVELLSSPRMPGGLK